MLTFQNLLILAAGLGTFIIFAFAIFCFVRWFKERKTDKGNAKNHTEFFKKVIGWFIINSTIWIYMSYGLAFLGMNEIAESLSKQVVLSVIGVVVSYAAKSLIENISKHNKWPDKSSKQNYYIDDEFSDYQYNQEFYNESDVDYNDYDDGRTI